ncbi:MAG TPA: hypothetical protein LFW11_06800 [Rickettsia endosymbiont of Proechinophthirus fluctus]|nr:hypothetical protein [Rickettsia endosymbiont of Proechinophthirus fluctus]
MDTVVKPRYDILVI